ncbi:cardiolipin synthase [Piscinibacter terrae]|uniref:Cardiolipin synthase n=1 Tax=Piscinibacter terrae TaxID=2496871 RepID=A0A3N7HMZ2_9BURK|nr:cardiolipin synthase [Albitalea terrae]RQP22021.1 cardiolipin synthase [Albitalea terrae]
MRVVRIHPILRSLFAVGLGIFFISGCRSLPAIHPDMAPVGKAPVLENGKGPLSAARSKAIIDELKRRTPDTNILERHLALEQAMVDSPLVTDNKVTLLQDGPATYKAMLAAIADAKSHVHMETYIFEDDETGRQFAQALIAKQNQGVPVAMIYDAVGTMGTSAEFFKTLTDAGVQVLQFNPVNPLTAKAGWNVNQRDHRKLLVVDGRTAFLGGINISAVYSGGSAKSAPRKGAKLPWRDTHLQIEGPAVAEYQRMFIDTWTKQKGPPLPSREFFPKLTPRGKEIVRAIAGSPDDAYSAIYATLISAIESAEKEIWLTNAYFAPDPQLRATLADAVKRGVDVRLILPSKTDSGLIFNAGRSYYDEMLQAGVKIYERRDALLHSKTAVIDGVWSTIGSTNLDWRSFLHNQEVNAVILGPDFAAQMKAVFEHDQAASTPVTLEAWQHRPVGWRIKEGLARMWEYWL